MKFGKAFVFVFIISLFALLYFLISGDNSDMVEDKIVTKIIDGDTIIIEGGETVRLLGYDCDERGKECYQGAKERMEELVLGKSVIVKREGDDKDQYGRSLRYIFLEGKNINKQMVEEGYCVARFPQDSEYKSEIVNAEQYAIVNKIGCKWNS